MSNQTEGTSPTSSIRVLIADDHPALRAGLVTVVNSQADMSVVAEASNGNEAVEQCKLKLPDVVLMDLRMPGGSGLDAINQLALAVPTARVIVLTTYDLDEDIFRAMRAGAKAYLLKDMPMAEITSAIRKVHAGEPVSLPHIESRLGNRLRREELTQRELEILRLIVKGLSNKEISAAIYISEDTVKSHMKRLFHKLGVSARTEAAIEGLKLGLVYL